MSTLTTNYGFTKPDLNSIGWGGLLNSTIDLIDTTLYSATQAASSIYTDGVTGVTYKLFINNGVLTPLPISLTASGIAFAIVFTDTVNYNNYAITVRSGTLRTVNIGALGIGTSVLTLIDATTGTHYSLSFANGTETSTAVAPTVAGVSSVKIADSDTGAHYSLSFNNGTFKQTSIA